MRGITMLVVLLAMPVASAGESAGPAAAEPKQSKVPAVFAAYVTPVGEPWNAVIHAALKAAESAGRIRYAWKDQLDTAEKQLAALEEEVARKPDIVVADAVDAEQEIFALARRHPAIAFLIGGPGAPQQPNASAFRSDYAEPAYLCGIVAGKMTKSNMVGVVSGKHGPEVHRTVNAFVEGARDANPGVKVKVDFIDAWYDPAKARGVALAQIAAGADALFAERAGVIAAARETGVLAFGSLVDQHDEAPDAVVTGTVWNMDPVVDHMIAQVVEGPIVAEDLTRFFTLAKGGVALAPWHGWERKLPPDVLRLVAEKKAALEAGTLVLKANGEKPKGD